MPTFSPKSEARLNTCHPDLQAVCRELIKQYDFAVLCGHRSKEEQDKAFKEGNSKVRYPQSKHNTKPSLAVDLAPYNETEPHIDWGNLYRFREMLHRFDALARLMRERGEIESEFEYGADWESFKDYPHVEIKTKEN